MKLRRESIVTVLALLAIATAIPYAIVDTLETGRVYLFSSQFLEELPRRFSGPGRFACCNIEQWKGTLGMGEPVVRVNPELNRRCRRAMHPEPGALGLAGDTRPPVPLFPAPRTWAGGCGQGGLGHVFCSEPA